MKIGGHDVIVDVKPTDALCALVLDYLAIVWPSMCTDVEREDCGGLLDVALMDNLFVYRDEAAAEFWETFGRTDENDDSMLQPVFEENRLTLVAADREDSQTRKIAEELKRMLLGLQRIVGERP